MPYALPVTAAVVLGIIVALARDWAPASLSMFGGLIVLLLLGIIPTEAALAGFANPAPITVAALFVLARAVEKTGALHPLVAKALDGGGEARSDWRLLTRLLVPVAAASTVLNNTPIVAMLISPITSWAERRKRPVSHFLLPLSFATILGGMVTLIGTSTNLVVSGLLVSIGQRPLGMFELSPIALPIALLGIPLLALTAPRLLPTRRGLREQFTSEMREYSIEMLVLPGAELQGQSVADAGLRHLDGVFLAWIRRGDRIISPVAPDDQLFEGDRLGFVGSVHRVLDLQSMRGLRATELGEPSTLGEGTLGFFEAVVAPISPLVGTTLKAIEFRDRYQATVLAIHRSGARLEGKLGEQDLEPGDTLLLLADRGFQARWRDRRDFLLVSHLDGSLPVSTSKARFVVLVSLAVVALAAAGVVPILQGSLAAALAFVLGGVLTPNEARNAVDLDVILLIAAAIGVGTAIETSGLAAVLAEWAVEPAARFGPMASLTAVVLVTVLLTELISNNAAAVLVFPIAIASAGAIGADPRPYAIAVALAASASFLTPIGYQTNALVYGPGGYRFRDYARLGFPLTLLAVIGIVLLSAWTAPS
jgi:di/tricarboxylate transporter